MNRVWKKVGKITRPTLFLCLSVASLVGLYIYKLGNLTSGTLASEKKVLTSASNLSLILDNPVNAPYKLVLYGISYISSSITTFRLVSVAVSLLSIVLFYRIAKHFYGNRHAMLTTAMYASSSVLLATSRQIGPSIMLLALFVLIICGYSIRFNRFKSGSWFITGLVIAVALYIPGMLYFILAGSIWQFKRIRKAFDSIKPVVLAGTVVLVVALVSPIFLAISKEPSIIKEFLGLPIVFDGLITSLKTFLSVPLGLFLYAPENVSLRLGHQPTLNAFEAGLFMLGVYSAFKSFSLDRAKMLLGVASITLIWASISANYEHTFVLIPFVYMLIGAGLNWLNNTWRTVFPTNPLARTFAMSLLVVGVFISCAFHLNRYFVAWPNNDKTKSIYISE